ncbi:MAG TPA: hypothetical protein VK609_20420, partial [Mucilaginibacter sp.]|nr:hypothetical protein [Mucilaginibacter sp.]
MKHIILTLSLCLAVILNSGGQTAVDYKSRVDIINKNIYKTFYDEKAGLYFETNDAVSNKGNHS